MTNRPEDAWPGVLRAATDGDAADVRWLIAGCFAEYEGCVLDPDGVDAWMAVPASSYADKGGQFWVLAERPGEAESAPGWGKDNPVKAALAACVGWAPYEPGRIELKNLYVSSTARRQGLGRRLVALVEATAREHGASAVVLWSDARFIDAHRLYEGLGYQRTGQQRELHDPSNSIEYGFVKTISFAPPGY